MLCSELRVCGASPSLSSCNLPACLSSSLSTTRSPKFAGKVLTLTSTSRPPIRREMRPSWGTRFSAISRRPITFIREIKSEANSRRGLTTSRMTPSTRNLTTKACSKVSICTSDAFSRIAWAKSALINRIIGASSCCSNKSLVSGKALARLARSISSPRSSIICFASPESLAYALPRSSSNSSAETMRSLNLCRT